MNRQSTYDHQAQGLASYEYEESKTRSQYSKGVTDGLTPARREKHTCAPLEWRDVDILTQDYDFDASIAMCRNPDMPHRLALYLSDFSGSYGTRSAYDGYDRYSGDD
jgi:hypothetical protein